MIDRNTRGSVRAFASPHVGMVAMGALRATLLFGSAAVALALIAVPIDSNHSRAKFTNSSLTHGLDLIRTGSIPL